MARFAFIIHPLNAKDVARKYPIAKFMPDWAIEAAIRRKKPIVASRIEGIVSKTGVHTDGWFIACPLTPKQMIRGMPIEQVYDRWR